MNYNWEKIGNRIKAERKAHGMSMNELAEEIGTTRQTISKWEKGEGVEITLNVLLSLCNVFDCELGYLLCEFECRTRDEVDICKKTGLSPEAVQNLLKLCSTSVPRRRSEYDESAHNVEGQNREYDVLCFVDDLLRHANFLEHGRAWVSLMTFAQKYQEYKKGRLTSEILNKKMSVLFMKVDARREQEAFFLQKYMLDFVEELGNLYVESKLNQLEKDELWQKEQWERQEILDWLEKVPRRAKENIDG